MTFRMAENLTDAEIVRNESNLSQLGIIHPFMAEFRVRYQQRHMPTLHRNLESRCPNTKVLGYATLYESSKKATKVEFSARD